MAQKLPKILMLHGSAFLRICTNHGNIANPMNASIFSKRVAAVRKVCQVHCEMVFVDAPIIVQAPDPTGAYVNKYDSAAVADPTPETDPALIPRAWWRTKEIPDGENGIKKIYEGLDESLRFIRRVIDEQGPFVACFGFSQGAALAGILTSILEHPSLHTAFSEPPLTSQKPFKAAILVSGFKLRHPPVWDRSSEGVDTKLTTRSLHVIGKTDTVIGDDLSQSLVDAFAEPRVERHDGGHFVPSKKSWRDFFALYMQSLNQPDKPDESLIASPGPKLDVLDAGAKF
ncbi:hypothetical protein KEM48_002783 [Puccinia striiformis f. sp. tritici PST-130]|nr:hypothetical protein H4Q26_002702 [Puccinia striiformis f. sp. tritici PST-130]KAI9609743.1 hypothetical protein KEM48_002783 [Puccinia striiformis f. sp. tritici PST-130]